MSGFSGGGVSLANANSWAAPQTFSAGVVIAAGQSLAWSNDLFQHRDAANTGAQRNAANAQRNKIFNSWTDATLGEWFDIDWITNPNIATIGTNKNGAGVARALRFIIGGNAWLDVGTGGVAEFVGAIATASSLYLGSPLANGVQVLCGNLSATVPTLWLTNAAGDNFGRIMIGGNNSGSPAIKRSATILQGRLADDSDFCPVQGKLRVHANAAAETPVATHTVRIFDAGGTEYKALVVAA